MLIGQGKNPLTFPIGLVLDNQLFGMRVLASHCLELQREYLTKENNWFMFDILNQGLWDQDMMDSPSDAASQGICQECYQKFALFAQFLSYSHNLWIIILFSSPSLC